MGELGAEKVTIVEIDYPFCTRTFGVGPCGAALSATNPHKCFNSRATCSFLAAYDPGIQTLRYGYNQSGLPQEATVFPALKSISDDPGSINLSGIDPKTTALGKRDRVVTVFDDFTYHDTLTDKYAAERRTGAAQFSGIGYRPEESGTHFGKQIARQPYYLGLAYRIRRGDAGAPLAALETEHYVISEWAGPDAAGRVQITAKDILDLADSEKSMAPEVSRGKIATALTVSDTSVTLQPAGIGVEYAAAGRVAIGREIMIFTRSGDVMTFNARGVDGTVATSHPVRALAQQCLRIEGARICDAAEIILNGAGISPAFIDTPAWQLEDDSWMSGLRVTATIPKPIGRAILVGELCQLGMMIFWDRRAQQLRYRANRPLAPGESYFPVTDAANIIAGTVDVNRSEAQRISEIRVWHSVIDPTEAADSERNYNKVEIVRGAENLYGQESIKNIYTRWFGVNGNDVAAAVIAERLYDRYAVTPKVISFSVDIKDRANIDLGGLIAVESYLLQSATGAGAVEPMQINMMKTGDGSIMVEAETYTITGRFGFWMQNPQADYDTATDLEKAEGAFWMDDTIGVFPDGTGPYVYF
jgi:hypothetical protein